MIACSLFPHKIQAKSILFGELKWDINPIYRSAPEQAFIRNDFDLKELSIASLANNNFENHSTRLLDAKSASIIGEIGSKVNHQAENAKLVINNGRATEFNPGLNGQGFDVYGLLSELSSPTDKINLSVITSQPSNKLSQTNSLGIMELVAVGESNFSGSPKNRLVNIKVGASKFDGLIIAAGEEFSFNKYLGDVDGEHGFLPELVIKPGGVVPEFGGGLCQVSSTAFRAAMNGGFPITERRNHSFAVQYYAPQGTDATIYPGVSDLKFVNDLPTNILIHTKIVDKKLYYEFYGTKDNRTVGFEGPVQYDKKTDGSMKATWTRHVTKYGETVTQTFNSKYLPPALFHRDEVVAPSTPNPESLTH